MVDTRKSSKKTAAPASAAAAKKKSTTSKKSKKSKKPSSSETGVRRRSLSTAACKHAGNKRYTIKSAKTGKLRTRCLRPKCTGNFLNSKYWLDRKKDGHCPVRDRSLIPSAWERRKENKLAAKGSDDEDLGPWDL